MTIALAEQITAPGVYDIPAEEYHRDPVAGGSLSSTGARRLLDCPAKFDWTRRHPSAPKREFDLGHAAHQLVLGAGPELVQVPPDEWRTKAVKEQVATIRAKGKVPLRPADYAAMYEMAAALRQHPLAGPLLAHGGQAEQTLVWRDERTGVMCRAMLDWRTGRIVADYKTTTNASSSEVRRTIANYGYHIQGAHYLDGAAAALGLDEAAFAIVAQEKEAPYLVNVVQLDDEYLAIGRARIARAREMYRDCTASGIWPGYPTDDIPALSPPRWLAYQQEEELDY